MFGLSVEACEARLFRCRCAAVSFGHLNGPFADLGQVRRALSLRGGVLWTPDYPKNIFLN